MSTPPAELPRCPCGHDRRHHMVSPEPDHGLLGWAWLMFGVSHTPERVRFRCRTCERVFDETDDPDELQRHAAS